MLALLMLAITIFNAIVIVPTYLTGDPLPSDDYLIVPGMSKMDAATILNITDTTPKMVFAYVQAIGILPFFAFYVVYLIRRKYYDWKVKADPLEDKFNDVDIARFTIDVHNLPIDESVE